MGNILALEFDDCDRSFHHNRIIAGNVFNFYNQRNLEEERLRAVVAKQRETIIGLKKDAIIAEKQHALDRARDEALLWRSVFFALAAAIFCMYIGIANVLYCLFYAFLLFICFMISMYIYENCPALHMFINEKIPALKGN